MEKESTPEAPAVRLPVDAMARDSLRHHGVTTSASAAQHAAAYNPFQTPVNDLGLTSASQPSFSAPDASRTSYVLPAQPVTSGASQTSLTNKPPPLSMTSLSAPLSVKTQSTSPRSNSPLLTSSSLRDVQRAASDQQLLTQQRHNQQQQHQQHYMQGQHVGQSSLLAPLSPSLPVFQTSAAVASSSSSAQSAHGGGQPGFSGATRHTQQSASSILKDVLQQ